LDSYLPEPIQRRFGEQKSTMESRYHYLKEYESLFAVGESKFGGVPDLPRAKLTEFCSQNEAWFKERGFNDNLIEELADRDGHVSNFLLQLNLTTMSAYDYSKKLPSDNGMLYVFGGCDRDLDSLNVRNTTVIHKSLYTQFFQLESKIRILLYG